jgi:sugar lactone lactonase YvrE
MKAISMPSHQIAPALDTPMQLGESPVWHPEEAALYWIDIAGHAVHRLHPDSGQHSQWAMPAEPGCVACCASGGLIVALRTGLALLNTADGSLSMLTAAPYDTLKMRFNDGRCDAAGRLWVGTLYEPRDQALAALYSVEHGVIHDSGKRATVSNGVAFSNDNRILYHTDTTTHTITAYDFDLATGSVGNGRLFQKFSTDKSTPDYGGRPDGAAVDSEGAYWCAMYEGGRLLRFAPDGELLCEIPLPVRCPTMMAFGGADLKTLYITSARHNRPADELARYPLSGCLLSLHVDVSGRIDAKYRTV